MNNNEFDKIQSDEIKNDENVSNINQNTQQQNANEAPTNNVNTYGYQNGNQYGGQQNTASNGGYNAYNPYQASYNAQTTNNTYNQNPSNGYGENPPKKNKSSLGLLKVSLLAICFSLIGGLIGAGGMFVATNIFDFGGDSSFGSTSTVLEGKRPNTVLDIKNIDTSKLMTAAEIYAVNVNSTVGITTSITTNFFGYQTTSAASGSGFVLTSDGYIVTNHHVIDEANTIKVSTYDGKSYDAQLIGYDENNDLAILKIDAKELSPVVLGDSDNVNVGDSVVAIGNPLGELTFSLTSGAISALNREVTMSNGIAMDLIQTDCAINSGNSGGALFNMYGEVIGITNAKYSSNSSGQASIDNIGFAIPINSVKSIIESIIEKGYISKPYIGVTVGDVSSQAQAYGLPAGAAVDSVTADGPAATAGIKRNDIITAVEGKKISSGNDLVDIVSATEPGKVLKFTIYRQGTVLELDVKIGEQRQVTASQGQSQQNSGGSSIIRPFN